MHKPKLIIPAEMEEKINLYVHSVNSEIAGMGKVEVNEDGDIVVVDIAIYEQEVTGGTADLSSEALAKFQTDLIRKGESVSMWRLWWHSHHTMQAFFSGTDTGTIDGSDEFEWLVSLVVNRRREREARLDIYRPFRMSNEDMEIVVEEPEAEVCTTCHREIEPEETALVFPDGMLAEVKEKVKTKSFSYGGYGGSGGGSQRSIGFGQSNDYSWNKHPRLLTGADGEPYVLYPDGRRSYNLEWTGEGPFDGFVDLSYLGKGDVTESAGGREDGNESNVILANVTDADEVRRIIDAIVDQMRIYEQSDATDDEDYKDLTTQLIDAQHRLTEIIYKIA